ncbi:hypothetical protein SY27_14130 [Flavobacterium sp. 316]|uniref:hypothetical protein n=1 Tax=Flavobacterium sp. 316 TaxID=1603293 RepID=UPI0005DF082E|nr:hypothetical protein [Flavobacterium sp. 316]KIX20265.1 hypothetical protein SY27_14130 [Flavobacterium sp. 316]
MKKSILSLKGTQTLSRNEQKVVNGGRGGCNCSTYGGPVVAPSCQFYYDLPEEHKCCVFLDFSWNC